jgi:hypothetical protein
VLERDIHVILRNHVRVTRKLCSVLCLLEACASQPTWPETGVFVDSYQQGAATRLGVATDALQKAVALRVVLLLLLLDLLIGMLCCTVLLLCHDSWTTTSAVQLSATAEQIGGPDGCLLRLLTEAAMRVCCYTRPV